MAPRPGAPEGQPGGPPDGEGGRVDPRGPARLVGGRRRPVLGHGARRPGRRLVPALHEDPRPHGRLPLGPVVRRRRDERRPQLPRPARERARGHDRGAGGRGRGRPHHPDDLRRAAAGGRARGGLPASARGEGRGPCRALHAHGRRRRRRPLRLPAGGRGRRAGLLGVRRRGARGATEGRRGRRADDRRRRVAPRQGRRHQVGRRRRGRPGPLDPPRDRQAPRGQPGPVDAGPRPRVGRRDLEGRARSSDRAPARRGDRDDPLHVGHDGPAQGHRAHARGLPRADDEGGRLRVRRQARGPLLLAHRHRLDDGAVGDDRRHVPRGHAAGLRGRAELAEARPPLRDRRAPPRHAPGRRPHRGPRAAPRGRRPRRGPRPLLAALPRLDRRALGRGLVDVVVRARSAASAAR